MSRAQWTETINSLEQDSLQAEGLARAMALLPFALTREMSELDVDTTPEESVVNGSFDNQSPQQRLGSGQVDKCRYAAVLSEYLDCPVVGQASLWYLATLPTAAILRTTHHYKSPYHNARLCLAAIFLGFVADRISSGLCAVELNAPRAMERRRCGQQVR